MPRERKIILVSGLVLLIFAGFYRFFPNIEKLIAGNNSSLATQKVISKYRQRAQEKERLHRRLSLLNSELARTEAGLLRGDTPALAAVDIQNAINVIAEDSQMEIRSMRVLKPREADDIQQKSAYLAIPVQVTLQASIQQLKEMLYRIETTDRLFRIRNLNIRQTNQQQPEVIQMTFTIEGFMKKMNKVGRGA